MPCYYTGSAEGDSDLMAEEVRKNLTQLTRWVCAAQQHGAIDVEKVSPKFRRWLRDHAAMDNKKGMKDA